MKIAMLLDNPFTEGLPYPKRVYYEAKSLVDNGYDVTIYCKNEKEINLPKFEVRDGIKIKRVFDYFLGTTVLVDKYLMANIDLFNNIDEKYDIYHCCDTHTWPIGHVLTNRDNAKYICESYEYFPDYICKEWHDDNFKYEFTKMLVNARGNYITYADKVITVSEETADELHDIYNLKEKPVTIYNTRPITYINKLGINKDKSVNILKEEYQIDKKTKILLFQGLVEPSRGLDVAIKLMNYLNDSILIIAGQDRGNYIKELKELSIKVGVEDKVIFTGFMPSDDLLVYSSYADFLVYFGKKSVKNMDLTIPNKFFDYIMVGKPIICSNLKSLEKFINRYKIGLSVDIDNEDIYSIAKKIQEYISNKLLISEAKENIKNIQNLYSWERQEEKLLNLYESL
ncbi:MAG: glycosyltransferase family 4 protein [Clostridiales bacterium]|nr:glycosyltransferase family 4 protein [Clostridiales bacterium]